MSRKKVLYPLTYNVVPEVNVYQKFKISLDLKGCQRK